tara:strand:+ start:90 stop:200 length:111 start_codon:yes stop_codon:yes gene_type:complete
MHQIYSEGIEKLNVLIEQHLVVAQGITIEICELPKL